MMRKKASRDTVPPLVDVCTQPSGIFGKASRSLTTLRAFFRFNLLMLIHQYTLHHLPNKKTWRTGFPNPMCKGNRSLRAKRPTGQSGPARRHQCAIAATYVYKAGRCISTYFRNTVDVDVDVDATSTRIEMGGKTAIGSGSVEH